MRKQKKSDFVMPVMVGREQDIQRYEMPGRYRELLDRMGDRSNDSIGQIWRDCRESLSTDVFPQLLGTTIGKRVIEMFKQWTPTWPLIAASDSVNKLGVNIPRVFVGEAADLVRKPEGHVIERNYFTDTQYTISANTYGTGYSFTRETVINDDTGQINRIAERMARAAARTIDKRLSTVILANANAYDSVAFFATGAWPTGHANYITTALSADLVGANLIATGCRAIMAQKDIDDRQYLGNVPAIAFTGLALSDTMRNLCTNPLVASPNVAAPTHAVQNPAYAYGLKPITFIELGDSTDWYLATDPGNGDPAWVVSFLNGDMAPKVLQRKLLYEGPAFVDAYGNPACDIEFDMIMDFEVSMGNPRSAYGGIVAGGT